MSAGGPPGRGVTNEGRAPDGPLTLSDPALQRLAERLATTASPASAQQPLPAYLAETLYLRGSLEAAGTFPTILPPSTPTSV